MNIKILIFCCLLSFMTVGCSDPLSSEHLKYAGTWVSADSRVQIVITPEGRIEYSNHQPEKSSSLSAPIKSFDHNGFQAGFGPFDTEFKVSQPPTQDAQGNWFMVVDGYTLAKNIS